MDELKPLEVILKQPLNTDNGHALAEQLAERAAWQQRVSAAHRKAEKELSDQRGKLFDPSKSSEDKRKIDLEYKTREKTAEVNELKDLSDILKQHISLGQSLLRSFESEIKSGVMTT